MPKSNVKLSNIFDKVSYALSETPVSAKLLLYLICYGCTDQGGVSNRSKGLNRHKNTRLKSFKFDKKDSRYEHRKRYYGFIRDYGSFQTDIFGDTCISYGLSKHNGYLDQLRSGNAIGYEAALALFCISAEFTGNDITKHLREFLEKNPRHKAWSQNHPLIMRIVRKLESGGYDVSNKKPSSFISAKPLNTLPVTKKCSGNKTKNTSHQDQNQTSDSSEEAQLFTALNQQDGHLDLIKSLADVLLENLKNNAGSDYFKDLNKVVIDEYNIDMVDFKTQNYRRSGINALRDVIANPSNVIRSQKHLIPANFKRHLFSVGGPVSNLSTRIALGYDENAKWLKDHALYYSYELELTELLIIENYGSGDVLVPHYYIKTRDPNGKIYRPKTKLISASGKYELISDIALLTMCPNPIDPTYKLFSISACQGVGCEALSRVLKDPRFQKEVNIPDIFDQHSHVQVLVEFNNVNWKNPRYAWNYGQQYYKVLEIQTNVFPNLERSTSEAKAIYKKMTSKKQT